MTITFGPPSYFWDGGIQTQFAKNAVAAFYHLMSADSGPAGLGATASVTTQPGYQLAASNTWFSTVALGAVASLPETSTPFSLSGLVVFITNTGANSLTVFPHPADAGGLINGGASVAVPAGSFQIFHSFAAGQWIAAPQSTFTQVAGLVVGGSAASSTLTLESTSGAGTTDAIIFKTGSQVTALTIDTNQNLVGAGSTWKITPAGVATFTDTISPLVVGGTTASSSLTLESTSGTGTTDSIIFKTGSQVTALTIDTGQNLIGAGSTWKITPAGVATFTDVISPLIVGGSAVSSTLTFESTSAAGTTDAIFFKTGSQVERIRIDANGAVTVGNGAVVSIGGLSSTFQSFVTGNWGLTSIISGGNALAPGIAQAKTRGANPATQGLLNASDVVASFWGYGSDGAAYQQLASIRFLVDGTPAANSMPGRINFATTPSGSTTSALALAITNAQQVLATAPTGGLGYASGLGVGGTVTQATSKSTAVTLNTLVGQITMNNAALASQATVQFQVNNSLVGANDCVIVWVGATASVAYIVCVGQVLAGNFFVTVRNSSGGSASDALSINFMVLKGTAN